MRVVLTLRKLLDEAYLGVSLFGQLSTADKNLAVFKDYIPDIDAYIIYNYGYETVRSKNPLDTFLAYLESWWRLRISDFNKVWNTFTDNYDPLSNYDMTEKEGSAKKRANIENAQVNTGGLSNTVGQRTSTNYSATNEDYSDPTKFDSKNIQASYTDGTTDTRTFTTTNKYKDENKSVTVGDDTLTGSETDERVLTRKGNIGVTTSQQMAESEIELRRNSFIKYFGECFESECLTGLFEYDWLD